MTICFKILQCPDFDNLGGVSHNQDLPKNHGASHGAFFFIRITFSWMGVADKDKLFHMFINCYIMVRVVQRTMSNFLPKVMTCPKTVARIGIAPSVNYLFSSVDGRIVEKINSFTQRITFEPSFTTRKLHDSRQFQYFKVIRLNKAEAEAVCLKISKS